MIDTDRLSAARQQVIDMVGFHRSTDRARLGYALDEVAAAANESLLFLLEHHAVDAWYDGANADAKRFQHCRICLAYSEPNARAEHIAPCPLAWRRP